MFLWISEVRLDVALWRGLVSELCRGAISVTSVAVLILFNGTIFRPQAQNKDFTSGGLQLSSMAPLWSITFSFFQLKVISADGMDCRENWSGE